MSRRWLSEQFPSYSSSGNIQKSIGVEIEHRCVKMEDQLVFDLPFKNSCETRLLGEPVLPPATHTHKHQLPPCVSPSVACQVEAH